MSQPAMFASPNALRDVVAAQKRGEARGIYSVCSANRFVIEASMLQALEDDTHLLIEATCNQVNQFGGYTGTTPAQFARYLGEIAADMRFPLDRLILGGDHLGPNPWQTESAESAMRKSRQMVQDYVRAGFVKIHLDASMHCADDDPSAPLDPQLSAERAADLCSAAERAFAESNCALPPVYVIGTEVPVPGGAAGDDHLQITRPDDAQRTFDLFCSVFEQHGLADAWDRVIALVVQPGVEFTNTDIHEYDTQKAQPLTHLVEQMPNIVYEAHSTDYQQAGHLRQMVADHFAILKVGPALTFAFREAVFTLAFIEEELFRGRSTSTSRLIYTLEQVMIETPSYWQRYYHGSMADQTFARKFSLSDRIRYYWPHPDVQKALGTLMNNLTSKPIPLSLLSQFVPQQYWKIREHSLNNSPDEIIRDYVRSVVRQYALACGSSL